MSAKSKILQKEECGVKWKEEDNIIYPYAPLVSKGIERYERLSRLAGLGFKYGYGAMKY